MKSYFNKLALILFIKFIALSLFVIYGDLRLGPDEAQYWTWSQNLSPGYYSKPPGIAYQIAFGTSLFGNTEFGVRFGSLVIGAITPFLIWHLARKLEFDEKGAFWSAVVWALAPLGFAGSLFAITDVGMILFWILGLIVLVERRPIWQLGLMIALGALFKWPIYILWLLALPFIPWDKKLLPALLLSLLGLLPSLWWNWQHDFATFKHVGATLQGGSGNKASGNFWEFMGAQVLLLSPIFFYLLIRGYKDKNKKLAFVYLATFLPLAIGAFLSTFMKVQGNWAIFAYPTAPFVVVAGSRENSKWLAAGAALSVALIIGALAFLPLKHNRDWEKLAPALIASGYNPEKEFLFSDKYQNTSLLSFYGPGQKQAFFLNLKGDRLNQFSFWPGLEKEKGRDGYYVTFDSQLPDLNPYFKSTEVLEPKLLGRKPLSLIHGFDFNGHLPDKSAKY